MPSGPGASRIFAIATSVAKKKGDRHFKKGGKGYADRSRIAESIARSRQSKQSFGFGQSSQ